MNPDVKQLIQVAKGEIAPGALTPGGALSPQQARRFISLVKKYPFLQNITVDTMTKLTKNGSVIDIPNRSLRRIKQGSEPTDAQKTGIDEFGYVLTAEECDLFVDITYDFLRDNQDNPNLSSELEQQFSDKISGELLDLAFNGVGEPADAKNVGFLELNKGWITIANESNAVSKVAIDPATDGWLQSLFNLATAMDDRFTGSSEFIMNSTDMMAYKLEVSRAVTGYAAVAKDDVKALLDIPVKGSPFCPRGHVMFTPPKNLVLGLNQDVTRSREPKARKRVVEYTWTMWNDFEIAAKAACVLGKPA